jgi:cell division initiation protein
MIDLTPLDVRKKKGDFRRGMRGYETAMVDDFLELVADRMEQLVRDNLALTERLGRLEEQVHETRDRERALTDALVTAQEMREDMRQQTLREAELARREAESQAARILRDAAESVEREQEALRQLRARQRQVVASYRAFLERELTELAVAAEALDRAGMEEPGRFDVGPKATRGAAPARGVGARPAAAKATAGGAAAGAAGAAGQAGAVTAGPTSAPGQPGDAAGDAAVSAIRDTDADLAAGRRQQDEFELLRLALEEEN